MDLALLVYLISVVTNLGDYLNISLVVVSVFLVASLIAIGVLGDVSYLSESRRLSMLESRKVAIKYATRSVIAIIVIGLISAFVPSEKTMYVMVGAYAAQKVYESPASEKIAEKTLKVIESKLDSYINEASDTIEKGVSKETPASPSPSPEV